MDSIKQLFSPDFIKQYLARRAPEFASQNDLSGLTITAIKSNIGNTSYHVVIRFDSAYLQDRPIFCSAHSDENRENAFRALTFIKKHSAGNPDFLWPCPLFFDKALNAIFYQGYDGNNLLHYIKDKACGISDYLKKTACWTAMLHNIPIETAQNYNKENSRIKTIIPGPSKFLPKIEKTFPEFFKPIKKEFERLVQEEEKNFANFDKLCLIHGDLHPENVIIAKAGEISIIDFTDICLSDWARDIGVFIQQIGYMSEGLRSREEIAMHQSMFYAEYLKMRSIKETKEIENRVNLYKSWSALRSAIYFLIKLHPEPENAKAVLKEISR